VASGERDSKRDKKIDNQAKACPFYDLASEVTESPAVPLRFQGPGIDSISSW
jgi:hypothetical protein